MFGYRIFVLIYLPFYVVTQAVSVNSSRYQNTSYSQFRGYSNADPQTIPHFEKDNKDAPDELINLMERGMEYDCDHPLKILERPIFTLFHHGNRKQRIDPEEFRDDPKGYIVGRLTSQENYYPDGFCIQVDFKNDHDVTLVKFPDVLNETEEEFIIQFWCLEVKRWEYIYETEHENTIKVFKYQDGARFLLPLPVRVLRLFPVKWKSYATVPFPDFLECGG